MMYRFTIQNDALYPDGVVVNQPMGWKDAKISLERDKLYHSLVEYFKGSFVWYGLAKEVLSEIEDDQGIEAIVRLTIEVYINYTTGWEEVFTGLIDLSELEDISKQATFYKLNAPIIRDDFWAKFINRKDTPIDLESTVDLDGGARTAVNKFTLPMPSQKIRSRFSGIDTSYISKSRNGLTTEFSNGDFLQFGFSGIIDINEIEEFFFISTDLNESMPVWILEAKYAGSYAFNVTVPVVVEGVDLGASPRIRYKDASSDYVEVIFMVNRTETNFNNHSLETYPNTPLVGPPLTDVGTVDYKINIFNHVETVNLEKGDIVRIFLRVINHTFDPDASRLIVISEGMDASGYLDYYVAGEHRLTLDITADTLFDETETDAYLIKDAAESIISKLVGADSVVVSDYLETCKGLDGIMKGMHVRGYSFTDKPFTMSFKDWWDGYGVLKCLGLGYTEVDGVPKIEIEDRSRFFDPTPVINFSNVGDLIRSYDTERYYKTIEVGFSEWSAESASGIDDPQTKRKYRTKFSTLGKDVSFLSRFYAASLGIEQTRRNRIEFGKDWRLDEAIMIIALAEYDGSYVPEFDENFESITNLLNSSYRINIRYAAARMFKTYQRFIQGCLQHTTGEKFYFASGEGNYDMVSKLSEYDCDVATEDEDTGLSEKQDIDVDTTNYDFVPKIYRAKIPMDYTQYKTIRDNRKKAIGISKTGVNFVPMHILDLDYPIAGGYADLLLMLATNEEP